MDEQRWLTFDMFDGRAGQGFEASADGVPAVAMELVEASESEAPGGAGPNGEQRLQFSVVFRGPIGPVLPQGSYRLEHAELGVLELFLVPIGPDAEGMQYEAAFA